MGQQKLRILCLHGLYQNSKSFAEKVRPISDACQDLAEFLFLDGPYLVTPKILSRPPRSSRIRPNAHGALDAQQGARGLSSSSVHPFRAWWVPPGVVGEVGEGERDDAMASEMHTCTAFHIKRFLASAGPVDGILGFSQGAALASLLCTNEAARHMEWTPSRAIYISGYVSDDSRGMHAEMFKSNVIPHLQTLHVYGEQDRVVLPEKSREMALFFRHQKEHRALVHRHADGHIVPKTAEFVDLVRRFLSA